MIWLVITLTLTNCCAAFVVDTAHPRQLLAPSSLFSSSRGINLQRTQQLRMSSEANDPDEGSGLEEKEKFRDERKARSDERMKGPSFFHLLMSQLQRTLPPLIVEDYQLLMFDILLILNLTVAISFFVVHRMSIDFITPSISEGSLMCILWIMSGLFHGAFLYSAVDGHYSPSDPRAGPGAAGMLGLHAFITASSLRVIAALFSAVLQHRQVGSIPGEDLIPLEIAFGIVLLSIWRLLHSSFTPRV